VASQVAKNLEIALVIGLLGVLVTFMPTPCRAQAEIDPDHYDTPSVGAATTNSPSAAKQRPSLIGKDFRGRFALPVDVNYGGVVLARGSYSISIHSRGKQNLVTFTSDRTGLKVQIRAQVSAESSAEGPSTLVLERASKQFQLTAIALNEPSMTLDLRARHRNDARWKTIFIPISDTRRVSSEN
jgi:hypothetical protein